MAAAVHIVLDDGFDDWVVRGDIGNDRPPFVKAADDNARTFCADAFTARS
jgi:hypothetical protein